MVIYLMEIQKTASLGNIYSFQNFVDARRVFDALKDFPIFLKDFPTFLKDFPTVYRIFRLHK